jgi:hypothetical protein
MYRYLLYCNLFRSDTPLDRGLESPITLYFFQKFSPWVNEQLACVHDYFERVLSRGESCIGYTIPEASICLSTNGAYFTAAFDEVAAHDVAWGYQGIVWRTGAEKNEHKQGYVRHLASSRRTAGVLTRPSS